MLQTLHSARFVKRLLVEINSFIVRGDVHGGGVGQV